MATLPDFHVGDSGTLTLWVKDAGTAVVFGVGATVTVYLEKPAGTVTTLTSAVGSSDGEITVTLAGTEFDTEGEYRLQAKIVFSGGATKRTRMIGFYVKPVLST